MRRSHTIAGLYLVIVAVLIARFAMRDFESRAWLWSVVLTLPWFIVSDSIVTLIRGGDTLWSPTVEQACYLVGAAALMQAAFLVWLVQAVEERYAAWARTDPGRAARWGRFRTRVLKPVGVAAIVLAPLTAGVLTLRSVLPERAAARAVEARLEARGLAVGTLRALNAAMRVWVRSAPAERPFPTIDDLLSVSRAALREDVDSLARLGYTARVARRPGRTAADTGYRIHLDAAGDRRSPWFAIGADGLVREHRGAAPAAFGRVVR